MLHFVTLLLPFCYPHSTYSTATSEVLTFLFAGQDSTAAAMASGLCFLTASPRCKAKLLQERHPGVPWVPGRSGGGLVGGGPQCLYEWFMFDHIFMSSGSKIPASVMFMCMFMQNDVHVYVHAEGLISSFTVFLFLYNCHGFVDSFMLIQSD